MHTQCVRVLYRSVHQKSSYHVTQGLLSQHSTEKRSELPKSRFALSPSLEKRQLLIFVVAQKVRFLVFMATSSGSFCADREHL